MNMLNNINIIIDNDYCISCGACSNICPFNNIEMFFNDFCGKWEPKIKNQEQCFKCNGLKNCLSVCPNFNVDFMKLADSQENNLLGKIYNIYTGYSRDYDTRFNSSSGGFTREICKVLLKNRIVDGVISITHQEKLEYIPEIITDPCKMPNSIYHNINYENTIKLLKENRGKYVVIGLPCHLTSLELVTKRQEFRDIKARIFLKIALICGYSFERTNMEAFSYYNNITLEEISYRESGRYRKTRISDKKKSVLFEVYKPKSIIEAINNMLMMDKFLCQTGCLYCVNHLGYSADIVVGDAWLEKYQHDSIGTNLIIVRSKKGQEAVSRMENFVFETGSLRDIIESQHIYALGSIGESIQKIKFNSKYYYPMFKRDKEPANIQKYRINVFEFIKLLYVKELLRKRKYNLARIIYIILELKTVLKLIVKKILWGK